MLNKQIHTPATMLT